MNEASQTRENFLCFEQESCLKQQLLKLAIQQEINHYFDNPRNIHNTLFLQFMRERILQFPLWSRRAEARAKCDELIMALPELCVHSQKATKRDLNNKSLRQVIVKCFDLAIRTPQERQRDMQMDQDQDQDQGQEKEQQPAHDDPTNSNVEDWQRDAMFSRITKQISDLFQGIMVDLEQKGGYHYLFQVVKNTSRLTDLHPVYQKLAASIAKALAIWIEKEMRDEKQLQKAKRVYRLTPVRAIRATLAIANPVKLMQGLITIFVARPFGSRNLIQKFSEVVVELKKTDKIRRNIQREVETNLRNHRPGFRKKLLLKIANYISTNYSVYHNTESYMDEAVDDGDDNNEHEHLEKLEPRELVLKVLTDRDTEPVLDVDEITKLHPEDIMLLHTLVIVEMRQKEKQDFVELLGNERMLRIIRELLPVIHEPIAMLFNRAHVGVHFETLFKTLQRIIKVAEREGDNPENNHARRLEAYERVMGKFVRDMYHFIHNIAANDDNTLADTLWWLMELLSFMKNDTIDVQSVLAVVPPGDRARVIYEIDQVISYRLHILALDEFKDQQSCNNNDGKIYEKHEVMMVDDVSDKKCKGKQKIQDKTATLEIPSTNTKSRPFLQVVPTLVNQFLQLVQTHFAKSNKTPPLLPVM
jgi:hypothetical protein